ncbi:MAG TPA: MarR family transcriptional regulator [Dehalococcoidia bacterium]|nr:MarR family transcriptional regulator [Dehalococcoidia bacterium]
MDEGRPARERLAMLLYGQALAIVDPIRVRTWAEADLTTGQVRALVLLRMEPGATLSWLSAELRVSAPTASGLVDRLVRQRYVRRQEDARDRRFVNHHLTERGSAIVSDIEREGRALFDRILSRLSEEELNTLVEGLTLLNGAAAEEARAASGTEAQR